MRYFQVPLKIVVYRTGTSQTTWDKSIERKRLQYGTKRERMHVLLWSRWPSYDFIFGVPLRGSRFYKEESGYFQYRDIRTKKDKCCFYVDLWELKQLRNGFNRLWEYHSRKKK